ncbi:MAG: hypothetical protein GY862_39410, partial [Gammaproteobacteria bacterium]|nr:hypothetical protein [Gammaproteobacteria bacterium]
ERVRFVTAAGREIVVQPALQNSKALLALLPDAFTLEIESNGNISIASDELQFIVRPEIVSRPAEEDAEPGVELLGHPLLPEHRLSIDFVFEDEAGSKRRQLLYPAPAHPEVLKAFLASIDNMDDVVLGADGSIASTEGVLGIFDFQVMPGKANGDIQFRPLPEDAGFVVIYPNGDRQSVFLAHGPDAVAERP